MSDGSSGGDGLIDSDNGLLDNGNLGRGLEDVTNKSSSVSGKKTVNLGEEMAAPKVEEKEEVLDEAKMAAIRKAMAMTITDNLDCAEAEENTEMADAEHVETLIRGSIALSKNKINILADLSSRSCYIPLRLSIKERRLLRIAHGALDISEYTDKVDVSNNDYFARSASDKSVTIMNEQQSLAQTIAGVAVCSDHKHLGAKILQDRSIADNEMLFQETLEVGRRYKIMNPDKMRSSYGKLLYAVMDNNGNPRQQQRLGFSLMMPMKTVATVLKSQECGKLLQDPLLAIAASEIESAGAELVEQAQREKKQASALLASKYCYVSKAEARLGAPGKMTEETLALVIASITDNASFLRSNRGPVDRMIFYLKKYFFPHVVPDKDSLSIRAGVGGSKLNHSHETQYYFVLQSLTLWREIMGNFFKLWCLAEMDLLDDRNGYRLANTGQGIQRCQTAPRVNRAMSEILHTVKQKVGRWIGLSVVHLGDRDVPNALVFIDKYTQVPRLLAPITSAIDQIDMIAKDPAIEKYINNSFGDKEVLRKQILADYFKHGFDGAGDDGGSCIDGRLTSTWNWCQKLEKKPFHPVFMLTGFQGFDGEFRNDE